MAHTVDDYLRTLNGEAKAWMKECIGYVRAQFPTVSEGLSYQVPTYRLGNAYLAFSVSAGHFIFHTDNEACLASLKSQLPTARLGKGAAKIPFTCPEAKPLLFAACHDILQGGHPPPPSL